MKQMGLLIKDFFAGYGKKEILHSVQLEVKQGELCGIIGPNGSGKTTLFRSLMNNEAWGKGSCFLNGQDMMKLTVKQKAQYFSFLPQTLLVPKGYLCVDVLATACYPRLHFLQPLTKAMKQEMKAVCEELDLTNFMNMEYGTLSEGQKQMILLGRTLLQKGEVIFLDEPDHSLDFSHKHEMLLMFQSLIHEKKKIGLMILHDPDTALSYCDRIYLMKDGLIVEEICPKIDSLEMMEKKLKRIYPRLRLNHEKQIYHIEYIET